MEKNNLPLEDVKVVELATVVDAPTCARMLGAYGAKVIKVESLDGDVMRTGGSHEFVPYEDTLNPLFTIHNSNKRFIALDFKNEKGKAILLDLIKDADIFITNIREQSLARNGLDYESLKSKFPALIYAHFSGYGPKGPVASNPGFDITAFWLRAGAVADWQTKGAFPFVPTYAFGDMATSSVFLSGILMALYAKEKTGKGTKVTTSLFANGIWCNAIGVVQTQFDRKHLNPAPLRPSDPFSRTYRCKDGRWIGIYCNDYGKDKAKFAQLLGVDDIVDDPRFQDIETMQRTGSIEEITARCNEIFLHRTSKEWRAYLSENNISCEIMMESQEVSHDPQAIDNRYMVPVTYPDAQHTQVMMPTPPIAFSEYGCRSYQPTGKIGEDTASILQELGYSHEEIQQMKKDKAVR